VGLGLADQAFSSLTNFGLGVVVARSVDARAFGAFGIVFATYLLALGVSRALHTDPLIVRFSDSERDALATATAAATGAALVGAGVLACGCALAAALAGTSVRATFAALAVCLPGLLVQDAWRWSFLAARRADRALVNDVAWACVMFPALAVVVTTGHATPATCVLVWGASATVAAGVGVVQSRVRPAPERARVWWRANRDLGVRYVGEFAATSSAGELSVYAVGAVSGLGAVGSIRAASLLVGPFNVVLMGVITVAVPEFVRLLRRSPERVRSASVAVSAALVIGAAAWLAAAAAVPRDVGTDLLHTNWSAARALLVPVGGYYVASAVAAGAVIAVRASGDARRSLRVRTVAAPTVIAAAIVGAFVNDARGAAWGMALANMAVAVAWWTYRGPGAAVPARPAGGGGAGTNPSS
jgi:hypothetical protein